jgi:hypothetical protein
MGLPTRLSPRALPWMPVIAPQMQYAPIGGPFHLASAIALNADAVLTYDRRLFESASEVGVPALSPGV